MKFQLLFWISSNRINSEEFEDRLDSLFLPEWVDNFKVKTFSCENTLSEICEEVITSINNRYTQIHVLFIGDNEVEKDLLHGHISFMQAISEFADEFVASKHHLLVCNLLPDISDFQLSHYRELLEKVTVGLKVILSVHIFAVNLHFISFQEWLINDEGCINKEQYYDRNEKTLNRKAIYCIIQELLKMMTDFEV